MKNFSKEFRVSPGKKAGLAKIDTSDTHGIDSKQKAKADLEESTQKLADLQYRLYAENRQALLIVFQALDAGGKDGTIRSVMSGLNPASCKVTSFKAPTPEELSHDFLWRIHKVAPGKGEIGIFNRSHYEDVLVVRVHNLVPKSVWSERYDQINRFEEMLAKNGTRIIKFMLHISKDEQRERLQARLDDPQKNWKVQMGDFEERKLWDEYMNAFEEALSRCSTPHAPWYVIPADKKWFRNVAVSQIIVDTLKDMNPKFPKPTLDVSKIKFE